jgi:hypothetical protein
MGILILLIIVAIVCLIGAVFLRIAAKLVDSLDVPFGEAYATVFIAALVGWVVGMMLGYVFRAMPAMRFLSIPINLLVQAGVFAWRLSITFGKALLISLVMIILWIAVWIIAGLLGIGIGSIIF